MDERNLIFPMTAGDLVESAQVLCQVQRGDGPDLRLCTVVGIDAGKGTEVSAPNAAYTLKDVANYETFTVRLKHDTPLLVTGIRRS